MKRYSYVLYGLLAVAICPAAFADVQWDPGILVSPDGSHLAFGIDRASRKDELSGGGKAGATDTMVCKTDGTNARVVGTTPEACYAVIWLDNEHVAATSLYPDAGRYYVYSTTDAEEMTIELPEGCDPLYKRLSPDAQSIAFVGSYLLDGEKAYGLFVADLDSKTVSPLLDGAYKTAPAWSPDSTRIAIGSGKGYVAQHTLLVADVNTLTVTNTGVEGVGADWSKDGRLAFTTEILSPGSWHNGVPIAGRIGILDPESSTTKTLTPAARYERQSSEFLVDSTGALGPVWSPDGQWIAYRQMSRYVQDGDSEKLDKTEIAVASVNGAEDFLVYEGAARYEWAPDSEALYILADHSIIKVEIPNGAVHTVFEW